MKNITQLLLNIVSEKMSVTAHSIIIKNLT